MNGLIISDSFDPWHNLAIEEMLFDSQGSGITLYLWQNRQTVVIGRHQNAWKECRHELLESDDGRLARRTTGGGAVYHDLGNLNFTFVVPKSDYDLTRQLSVIIHAAASLGITANFTGRNDIVTQDGAKFSGNAFRFSRSMGMHHGTLLINADIAMLSRYLVPSAAKLKSNGVDSVRARVKNLCEINPTLTIDDMKNALTSAFKSEYGAVNQFSESMFDPVKFHDIEAKHASWEWRLGASPSFDVSFSKKFQWGELELMLSASNGIITSAAAYSDAMDEGFIGAIPAALKGARMTPNEMSKALLKLDSPFSNDVSDWLKKNAE